ncbi:MAG: Gfo/Idh/MocA family oxidoreductase [Candidatus Aminicenantes bacterium]|nr:Gfo/Idh/MocA family oxidoreductase [Candidatus Aminicenantes bacterium]
MKRRDALKSLGAAAGSTALFREVYSKKYDDDETAKALIEQDQAGPSLGIPPSYEWKKPAKPLTAAVLGAGNRGHVYAGYALKYPEELNIVGVAEPIPWRRERFAAEHHIPAERQWTTWERAFDGSRFCDAMIITTWDRLHYGAAMAALEKGYHLILEKAIAQSWDQCRDILRLAERKDRIVAICHVLRYTPYFRMMKHAVDTGRIGRIISVQHTEPFGNIHMSHAFVRGNWRNSKESTPILLSKSCHDLDILRWIIGEPCRRVTSFGRLSFFQKENAPKGSTARCTDGCAVEKDCIYSALRIYLREKIWDTNHLYIPDTRPATILKALQEGRYGTCVFRSDNDVVDHQVVGMEFGDGITAGFNMEGMTSYGGRKTRIFGTEGDIVGDSETLTVTEFNTGKQHIWDIRQHASISSGHGGGDHGLARDFIQAVTRSDARLLTSTLADSMESHLIGFTAENSRHNGGAVREIDLKRAGTV